MGAPSIKATAVIMATFCGPGVNNCASTPDKVRWDVPPIVQIIGEGKFQLTGTEMLIVYNLDGDSFDLQWRSAHRMVAGGYLEAVDRALAWAEELRQMHIKP